MASNMLQPEEQASTAAGEAAAVPEQESSLEENLAEQEAAAPTGRDAEETLEEIVEEIVPISPIGDSQHSEADTQSESGFESEITSFSFYGCVREILNEELSRMSATRASLMPENRGNGARRVNIMNRTPRPDSEPEGSKQGDSGSGGRQDNTTKRTQPPHTDPPVPKKYMFEGLETPSESDSDS